MRNVFTDIEPWDDEKDPMVSAQEKMKHKLPKRFYEKAESLASENGVEIRLDGRSVKTPARKILELPNQALADLIAQEFNAQVDVIDPAKMPITRLANTVIDGIAEDSEPVVEDLLRFGLSDLLFYRASAPVELVERQQKLWDPILDWAETRLTTRFTLGEGVMFIPQSDNSSWAIRSYLQNYFAKPFELAALHMLTTLSGSALIAFAVNDGHLTVEDGWRIAHLDEDWTNEQWGKDEEAMMRRSNREAEFYAASAVLAALK